MKLSPSGTSISTQNQQKNARPPKRTANKGWTKHAALRNRRFLFSVVPEQLSGYGFSVTHTVETCPSPELWAKWIKSYFRNLARRWPLTRWHAVTEWQRRGVPHFHAALWFNGETSLGSSSVTALPCSGSSKSVSNPTHVREGIDIPYAHQMIDLWLKITTEGGSQKWGQDVKSIALDDAGHWLQYLAKHGSRGVSNYQRHYSNVPKDWKQRTCQVWNKGGNWPIENPVEVHGLSQADKYQVRRVFCNFLASAPASHRIKKTSRDSVRRYWSNFLKCTDVKSSRFRSPTSFISIEDQVRLIKCVNSDAYFTDTETGEIFTDVQDMPVDRSPRWKPLPFERAETSMDDLL